MKKLIVTLACMLTLGAMQAQEVAKEKEFFMEAKVGMENFNNYSAVSVFTDETANYSGASGEINFGYRFSNNSAIELTFFAGGINTSNIVTNEYFHNYGFAIGCRKNFAITEKSEFYCGLRTGMICSNNIFSFQNKDYSIGRYGLKTNVTIGYKYYIKPKNYIGISIAFPSCGVFTSSDNIPTELSNFSTNQRTAISGFGINVGWGIKF